MTFSWSGALSHVLMVGETPDMDLVAASGHVLQRLRRGLLLEGKTVLEISGAPVEGGA